MAAHRKTDFVPGEHKPVGARGQTQKTEKNPVPSSAREVHHLPTVLLPARHQRRPERQGQILFDADPAVSFTKYRTPF